MRLVTHPASVKHGVPCFTEPLTLHCCLFRNVEPGLLFDPDSKVEAPHRSSPAETLKTLVPDVPEYLCCLADAAYASTTSRIPCSQSLGGSSLRTSSRDSAVTGLTR